MRPCFKFSAAASADQPATLSIFDEIGFWGVQAKDFIAQLAAVESKTIHVEINSPGGDVFAGLAIYNALKGSGKEIVTKVMGVAASAASLIMMAGDKRVMPKNTFTMVHNPWSMAVGNAEELRQTADTLDKIGASLQATYVAATGQSEDKIAELLAKDTWLTADESLELGFATEVIEGVEAKASFDMARADLPENVKAVFAQAQEVEDEPADTVPADLDDAADEANKAAQEVVEDLFSDPALVEQIEAMAAKASLGEHGKVIALAASSLDEAKARISAAREICALCKVAGMPDVAAKAIKDNTSVADVRAALLKARADADQHIDTSVKDPADAPRASSGVSTGSIWDSHRKSSQRKGS